jgi:hypothetical protein
VNLSERLQIGSLRAAPAVALAVLLCGCGDSNDGPTPEQLAERGQAFRDACASISILRTAADDLAVIEAAFATVDPSDAGAVFGQRAAAAAHDYSRAYLAHAELRAGALTSLDSAVNHSRTPADSIRFTERAASYILRTPLSGTIEANVLTSYDAALVEILADPDHRCNWDTGY